MESGCRTHWFRCPDKAGIWYNITMNAQAVKGLGDDILSPATCVHLGMQASVRASFHTAQRLKRSFNHHRPPCANQDLPAKTGRGSHVCVLVSRLEIVRELGVKGSGGACMPEGGEFKIPRISPSMSTAKSKMSRGLRLFGSARALRNRPQACRGSDNATRSADH
jgi:hypothetical protein